jgi:hypothetical protein
MCIVYPSVDPNKLKQINCAYRLPPDVIQFDVWAREVLFRYRSSAVGFKSDNPDWFVYYIGEDNAVNLERSRPVSVVCVPGDEVAQIMEGKQIYFTLPRYSPHTINGWIGLYATQRRTFKKPIPCISGYIMSLVKVRAFYPTLKEWEELDGQILATNFPTLEDRDELAAVTNERQPLVCQVLKAKPLPEPIRVCRPVPIWTWQLPDGLLDWFEDACLGWGPSESNDEVCDDAI